MSRPTQFEARRTPWSKGWHRLTRIWRSDTVANVDEELRFHFEQKVAEFEAQGLSTADALARAEAEFGDVQTVHDSLTEIDGRVAKRRQRAEWWEGALQDLRYVARGLRRSPGFSLTVIVTLALGLGANAAIFSLLDRLYVQTPAGVANAEEVRRVYYRRLNRGEFYTGQTFDRQGLERLRAIAPDGMQLAGYSTDKRTLGRSADDPSVNVNFVDGNYFGVLQLQPALGRFFSAEETDVRRTEMVAIISSSLWHTRFNGDPAVIGQMIDVGSHRHQIIGVAPAEFRGLELDVVDVWVPRSTNGTLLNRAADWYDVPTGTADLRIVVRERDESKARLFENRATIAERGKQNRNSTGTVFFGSIIEARGGTSHESELKISTRLAGVAVVILLIACANVVNLLLARASVRQREIALRLALGVSRARLVTQLVIESSVLALAAGVMALVVAFVATKLLRNLLLPDIHWGAGAIDQRAIIFTAGIALATGFLAGLIPALQSSRPDLSGALKSSVRDGGNRHGTLRAGLLVAQAALSVVLLAGAGVFVSSMRSVEAIDVGFDVDRLMFAGIGYDRELGNRSAEIAQRMPQAAARLRRIPGVEQVALAGSIPMYGFGLGELHLPDRDSTPRDPKGLIFRSNVGHEFFATVGMRAVKGRLFDQRDNAGSEPVIVVNKAFADLFWPGEDPLQKCVIAGPRSNPCRRVIGIVSHANYDGYIEEDAAKQYYLPLEQSAADFRAGTIAIRVAPGRAGAVALQVQHELADEFGSWSRPSIKIMGELLAPKLRPWRVGAQLFTIAGLLALLVAAVGVYSSMAYTISQRTQEMGVRIALGASGASIMRLVIADGVRVVAFGVALGLLIALALGSLVASLLYKTSPRDPLVLSASIMTLLVVTVVACSIPAWRASRADPLTALRVE